MACVSLNVVFPGKMEKVQMLQGMGKSSRCFYPKKNCEWHQQNGA